MVEERVARGRIAFVAGQQNALRVGQAHASLSPHGEPVVLLLQVPIAHDRVELLGAQKLESPRDRARRAHGVA